MKNFENEFKTETMTQACHNGFTRLVKPFRSDLDSSVEPKAQSDSQSSQTKYRNCVAHSYGFTLSETLITVAILGVVAAITIPAIINHQTESANRTKLKKAMTTYEKALNQMIIENDLKTNQAINDFGSDGENCKNTTEYFKKVEGSGCRFKTADRIWWDISDIENPLVMLKDKYSEETIANLKTLAKKEDDREVFGMVGRLDDTTGVLRINDKGAETAGDNKTYLDKLYGFINSSSSSDEATYSGSEYNFLQRVSEIASEITTECSYETYEYKNCYQIQMCGDWHNVVYYDENGIEVLDKWQCTGGTGENCQFFSRYDYNIPLDSSGITDCGSTGCGTTGTRDIIYHNCNNDGVCTNVEMSDKNIPVKNGGTKNISYQCDDGDLEKCMVVGSVYTYPDIVLSNGYKISDARFDNCDGDEVTSCKYFLGHISTGTNTYSYCGISCNNSLGSGETCPSASEIAQWLYNE